MYLLNSLMLSSKRLPLTLSELAHKIETKQMTVMFDIPESNLERLLINNRNVSIGLQNFHRAVTANPAEYYSVITTGGD
jgi:hypothetical protein